MVGAAGGHVARAYRDCRRATGRLSCTVEHLERRALLSAGSLDPSFGGDGTVTTDFQGAAGDRGRQIALQADGKILEVGWHQGFSVAEVTTSVTRFNADGSLDTTFGNNGLVIVDVPDRGESIGSIGVAPNGKIYVGTWSTNPPSDPVASDSDYLIARLNIDGSLDTTFDGDGIRLIDFGTTQGGPGAARTSDLMLDLVVQADGKPIAVGVTGTGTQSVIGLARLNLDGSLDTSFDGDGVAMAPFGSNYIFVGTVSVTLDAQHRIIVGSGAGPGPIVNNADFVVARYLPNGSLDPTFSDDGWTLTPFSTANDGANEVAIAPDGKIVAAGYALPAVGSPRDMAVVRYNEDGSLDPFFSGDGKVLFGITNGSSPNSDEVTGMTVDTDTSILLTGPTSTTVNPRTTRRILVRLDPIGSPDGSFGTNGVADLQLSESSSIIIQPQDSLILVGGILTRPAPDNTFEDFAVERLDWLGGRDVTFGNGGVAFAEFPGPGFNTPRSGVVQADGKTVVGGFILPRASERHLAFVRYNADGSVDATFGSGGRAVIDLAAATGVAYTGDDLAAMALDADGRIVFAGSVEVPLAGATRDMMAGRLNPDGTLDSSFGTGGIAVLSNLFQPSSSNEIANDLVIQQDGSILLVGRYASSTSTEFALARVLPSGELDGTFGWFGVTPGILRTQVAGTNSEANAVIEVPDPNGEGHNYIVVGRARNGSRDEFAVAVYNDDGALDTGFDIDGKLSTPMGNGNATATDVVIDRLGRIVVAGYAPNPISVTTSRDDFALARYGTSGALDLSFDGDGKVYTDFVRGVDRINSVIALPDGTILAGGFAETTPDGPGPSSGRDYAIARYGLLGELVTSFGTGGKVLTNLDPTPSGSSPLAGRDEILELLPYPGDRVVAVGSTVTSKEGNDYSAARYFLVDSTPPARVTLRGLFYNHSKFDGNNPAIDDQDFEAISEKAALRPGGTAGFNHYTSYSRGINGIVVLFDANVSPVIGDFIFRVGNDSAPGAWPLGPTPTGFAVRPASGGPGTAVLITFADGAVRNTWLQVTVRMNERTRLGGPDVFYFGNLVGDAGNFGGIPGSTATVDALDVTFTRMQHSASVNPSSPYDFNRDGVVNIRDEMLARGNLGRSIALIRPPAAAAAASPLPTAASAGISRTSRQARRRGVWEQVAG